MDQRARKTIDMYLYWSENAIAKELMQQFEATAVSGFKQEVTT